MKHYPSDCSSREYFQIKGKEYKDLHEILSAATDMTCGEEFIATVRRLGVILFRIAMRLST